MPVPDTITLEQFKTWVGKQLAPTDWITVDQARIDKFADCTDDHQFIHVDPEKCKELSPWGVPIAHGFLTLSMLVHLNASIEKDMSRYDGVVMGVNYGFEKVRFINPVKVGSRIRSHSVLSKVELKDPSTIHTTSTVTVEIEGESKPAVVAERVTRLVYA